MEEPQRTDLNYITERIISVLCPAECPEHVYLQNLQDILAMLQSKHKHNFLIINVSQKNEAFSRMTHQVLDTGWLDHLAPNLDQIFSVCSSMENWLQTHSRRVVVLHCRGGKGQLGVLVASYVLFSSMLDSADLSLDRFSMKKFYSSKLAALMTPSQKRYVRLVSFMLKGELKTPPSLSFLLCIILQGLPRWRPDGECQLFLRVYQGFQAVYTSAVHQVSAAWTDRLCFLLQPAQLLQDDVMVVCYDKNSPSGGRRAVFRLQFHMGLVSRHTLTFLKPELDCASEDPTFPEDGKVELLLSDSPEMIRGRELWLNSGCVSVDYDTLDPLVRRDSYQDLSLHTDAGLLLDLHPGGLVKRSSEEGAPLLLAPGSLVRSERTPSASSDSGLSVASRGGGPLDRLPQTGRLGAGQDFELVPPLLEIMTELAAWGRGDAVAVDAGLGVAINGAPPLHQRETDAVEDKQGAASASASASEGLSSSSVFQNLPGTQEGSWTRRTPPTLAPSTTPTRGLSRVEAVQKGPVLTPNTSSEPEEDLSSLSADADESIEKLNQLIVDLDPTFVPVPTRSSPPSRSASLHTNGLSHKRKTHQSGWRGQNQLRDLEDHGGLSSPGWRSFPTSTDQGHFFSEDHRGDVTSSAIIPPTPAFPVSPPTPYVKHFPDSQWKAGRLQPKHNWTQDSRSFLDALNHSGPPDGAVLTPESVPPASNQRTFGSMCLVSSESSPPSTDSATPPPLWIPNPQSSPPLSVSTPIASSSPQGALRGLSRGLGLHGVTDITDLSLLLGNGSLEPSLLEAVEGLESLDLGGRPKALPPLLPEKRRGSESKECLGSLSLSGLSSPRSGSGSSLSLSLPFSSPRTPDSLRGASGAQSPGSDFGGKTDTVKFVQDTSKFWYKPDISRDQAIAVLKDKEPGAFVVRDSHSFRGAYGLAVKVATPPPSVSQQSKKGCDLASELVRHFLIECTQRGVRLKGCPNEPYFGSLTALVCQHSITPLALPCKLILPNRDPVDELTETSAPTAANSAAELLKQGAACNVWFLGSVELETLTGPQAVQKATTLTIAMETPPQSTVVHFKVSAQGITLTDNQRKLFFRRHYAVNTVIFCCLDPQGRRWTRGSSSSAKIFGFVARKAQSETENECHLFAEHDPEQPASAIVNFVSKVMIGSHKK